MTIDESVQESKRWHEDGTWDRLQRACDTRATINIRRSSGETVRGVLVEVGVRCIVAWGDGAERYERRAGGYYLGPGVQSKSPLASEVLAWNPEIAGGASCR